VEVEGRANVRSGLSASADKPDGTRETAAGSAPVIGRAVDKRATMQFE
jgi:hypothetical protein